jgi:large-conductance mechanosensitive channel
MARYYTDRRAPPQLTSKSILAFLAVVSMGASAINWWGIQSILTPSKPMAVAYTLLLVLAPPSLMSFLIPWSPGGMLLQKVNARTWGYFVVVTCAILLVYYSIQLQSAWWMAQKVTVESGMVYQQVLISIIGFIIIPALLFAPVSSEELVEQVKQAHLVKRYELQTQADIAILRATLLRAQEKALIGFANLTVEEREELAGVMRGLVAGIDRTLIEVGQSVKRISGATAPFYALEDNEDVQEVLDYIGNSLIGVVEDEPEPEDERVMQTARRRHVGRN